MSQFLSTIVPMFAFMLIPVWIPVIAVVVGSVVDVIRPKRVSAGEIAVEAAKERSLAGRQALTRDRRAPGPLPVAHAEIADQSLAA